MIFFGNILIIILRVREMQRNFTPISNVPQILFSSHIYKLSIFYVHLIIRILTVISFMNIPQLVRYILPSLDI